MCEKEMTESVQEFILEVILRDMDRAMKGFKKENNKKKIRFL